MLFRIFSLGLLISLSSCGSKSSGNGGGSTTELEGVWQTGCITFTAADSTNYYIKGVYTFTGNTSKTNTVFYGTDNCSVSYQSSTETSTFTIGDALTTITGAKKLNSTTQTVTQTYTNADKVTSANTAKAYSYTDWVLNTPKDVTGKKHDDTSEAERAAGAVSYDIFKITGTTMILGDHDTGVGTSEETRPTSLESSTYTFTKQ